MSRSCTICTHPDRAKIEAMVSGGQSVREVALATGVSRDALMRHQAHAEWGKVVAAQDREEKKSITPRVKDFPTFIEFCTDVLKLDLTDGQSALARVAFGGDDPIDVGPLAVQLFGGVERIPAGARSRVVLRLGRGSGKTTLCVAYGLWRIEYADLSMCGPGDEAVVMIVAPLKIISATDVNMGESLAKNTPSIASRVRVANSERITIERTGDKRRASLLCIPKSGGAAARGKSVVDFVFDEAELVQNSEANAVTDVELIRAATPRLIRDGRVFLISTPYPFPSQSRELFKANFGKPSTATVALATTLQMRAGNLDIEALFARELAIDPDNARREFLCEETATAGSFLSPEQVDASVGPTEATGHNASCGIDLAFVNDSSACIIVERQSGKVVLTRLELLSPQPKAPLVPSEVITGFAMLATSSGAFQALADSWYLESVKEVAIKLGMAVSAGPTHTAFEIAALYFRDLVRNRQIVIPPNEQLLDQLKSVQSAPKPGGGVALTFPRRIGAGHADLVPALVYACWLDRCKYGPIANTTTAMPSRGLGGGFQKW